MHDSPRSCARVTFPISEAFRHADCTSNALMRSVARGFIPELDGLRGIAILMVMIHRFWPRTGVGVAADLAGTGWIGVDLFFVISGFLITGILLDTKDDGGYFKNFYARRMLRIFPLYYLFVIGVFVAFSGNPAFREHAGSPFWYLAHLGNVPEGVLEHDVPYWLGPIWSLAIEEQFYLTFPWLVYALDRRKLTLLLFGMILAAPLIRLTTMLALPDHERFQYLFTLCRIDTIAVGCLLAVAVRALDLERHRKTVFRIAVVAMPMIVVLAIGSHLDRTSPFDRVFGYSIVAIGCAAVLALVLLGRGQRSTAMLRFAPLAYLGKLCFGLYLLHRPADTIVSALAARIGLSGELWLMPAKLVMAVVLATISWRLIERPFLGLKDRFASARHPSAAPATSSPSWVVRVLRLVGLASLLMIACNRPGLIGGDDAPVLPDGTVVVDGRIADMAGDPDAAPPIDAPLPVEGQVLYVEGAIHSPITPALAERLQALAAHQPKVFAKVGDSITAADSFLDCFADDFDLGNHGELAPTIAFFDAGSAAGSSPFSRTSYAAIGGTTSSDAMAGSPCTVDRELDAIDPRYAVVLFGTNEVRYGWTLDAYGSALWDLIDHLSQRGTIPILSTMPANVGYPEADAKIPTYNRVVRALAQGYGMPLVDLHRALAPLPNRGISGDGLHPSTAPGGACLLTSAGLAYGYNMRNLITVEALARVRAAIDGAPPSSSAPTRTGHGLHADPFVASLPLVDLGTTSAGDLAIDHGCGGAGAAHEITYRVELGSPTTIAAHVIGHAGSNPDVHVIQNGSCIATGDRSVTVTASAGPLTIVVDTAGSDGEYVIVVERV